MMITALVYGTFFLAWFGCFKAISKLANKPSKVLSIGGGFIGALIFTGVFAFVGSALTGNMNHASEQNNQPSSGNSERTEVVTQVDQNLSKITQYLVQKHAFTEDTKFTEKYGVSLKQRNLTYSNGNCNYAITIAAKDYLELSGALTSSDNQNLQTCLRSNPEIASHFFIHLTNFRESFSPAGGGAFVSKMISISGVSSDANEVITIDGVKFAVDHTRGNITWMTAMTLPAYLK